MSRRDEAEKTIVYWADETGVSNCEIAERGFLPKGCPPVLEVETKHQRVNLISAISRQGKVHFMVYQDTMNQQCLIRFMEQLSRASKQKFFLILDIGRFIMASLWRPGRSTARTESKYFSCLPMRRNTIRMNIGIMR